METKKISNEMYEALKKPLPSEAIKPHPTKSYLSAIKAIYVTERLNDVFGCGSWQIRTERVSENSNGMVVIKTTLSIPEYGVYYESYGGNDNGGQNSKNFDIGDAYKGATTDGITKIGSYLGIGIDVFKGKVTPQQETESETPELPWLNRNDKAGNVLPSYQKVITAAKEKGYTADDLKKYYRISKTVYSELENDLQ